MNSIMEEFEVVGYYSEEKITEREYFIAAINYRPPSYVKIISRIPLRKGVVFQIDGENVYIENVRIGAVKERRSSADIGLNVDYDPRFTGGYSMDGNTVFLDEHFPKTLFVSGLMVSTVESIGLHHELPEKWLMDDGFSREKAHGVAMGIERKYVESLGVEWPEYCSEVRKNLKKVYWGGKDRKDLTPEKAHYLYCMEDLLPQATS